MHALKVPVFLLSRSNRVACWRRTRTKIVAFVPRAPPHNEKSDKNRPAF
jgi:hypothetical protein